jgi:hypothetical protein
MIDNFKVIGVIKMKKYFKCLLICMLSLLALLMFGCSTKENNVEGNLVSTEGAKLLFQETVSPNKEYIESDSDIVYYTVEIYQNSDNSIIVNADSNSEFYKKTQYVLEFDKAISETDIDVEWTTVMGNPEPTKDDQLAIAQVSISENGEIISQRKINFFKKGIEIIIDTINQQ